MPPPSPEVLDRKLAALRRFLADLGDYARLDREAHRREHYAIERLAQRDGLPADLADALVAACGMRDVLTHLYDVIDLDRVIDAADPTRAVYGRYAEWVRGRLVQRSGQPGDPTTEPPGGAPDSEPQPDP